MSLQDRINDDYISAYKAHNEHVVSVLRLLRSAIKNAEIDKKGGLNEEDIFLIVRREIKHRDEAKTEYEKAGNSAAAEKEQQEIVVLEKYLPEQISENEIKKVVREIISDLGIADTSGTGRAIGAVMAKLKGRANGSLVAKIVRDTISEKS